MPAKDGEYSIDSCEDERAIDGFLPLLMENDEIWDSGLWALVPCRLPDFRKRVYSEFSKCHRGATASRRRSGHLGLRGDEDGYDVRADPHDGAAGNAPPDAPSGYPWDPYCHEEGDGDPYSHRPRTKNPDVHRPKNKA